MALNKKLYNRDMSAEHAKHNPIPIRLLTSTLVLAGGILYINAINNPGNYKIENSATPIPISLEDYPIQDRYSRLFEKITDKEATQSEILEFNKQTVENNSVKDAPKIQGLTAVEYVIGDKPDNMRRVTGYINDKGELIAYLENGSITQIKK